MKSPLLPPFAALGLSFGIAAAAGPISGIDAEQLSSSVRPQDDFNAYVNGTWIRETEIPADKQAWGAFEILGEESEKNPYVAGPLKRTDCSLVSDGAAALVLADEETALQMRRAVGFRGMAHVQDFLPMSKRDILKFEGGALAWQKALAQAGVTLDDLSFVETHDCFTIAELIEYEAMGLTKEGDGARAIKEGWTQKDGKLPVNVSGGLKAKGHPIGATGVSMHVLSAMQLVGEAPEGMQVKDARLGGIFNMGGAAVANYVSVLERVK